MSKEWCVAAACLAALPYSAVHADAAAKTPFVYLNGNGVSLTVGAGATAPTPETRAVNESAALSVDLPNGQAKIEGGFSASAQPGDEVPSSGNWHSGHVALTTSLDGPANSALKFEAQSQFRNTTQQGQAVLAAGAARADIAETSQKAVLTGTIAPSSIVKLQLDTMVSRTTQTDGQYSLTGNFNRSQLATETERNTALATLAPLHWLTFGGGGSLETISAEWQGTNALGDADTYSYVEPQLHAGLTPLSGISLKTSIGEVVQPLNTANFVALAASAGPTTDLTVEPERQWQSQTNLDVKLAADIALTAQFTHADVEGVTELVPLAAGGQAPASIAAGHRTEFSLGLNASLAALGFPHLNFEAGGAWRQSNVVDPLTSSSRRLSGEIPREARFKITRTVPGRHLKWGLTGSLGTEQTLYQAAQVTTIDCNSTLGAFVEYSPGPFALQLSMDGLAGGTRTQRDVFYENSRADGAIANTIITASSGPRLNLSLAHDF